MCGCGTPGDGDFQGTEGPRDADILHMSVAHSWKISGNRHSQGLKSKMECPQPPYTLFHFHSSRRHLVSPQILFTMAISPFPRAKALLADSQKAFDPVGSPSWC